MPKKKFSTENDVSNFRSKSQKSRCPNPRRTHVTNRTKPKHFPIGSDATAPTFRHVSLKFHRVETKARTERFERKLVFQKCIVLQEVVSYVDLMCSEPTLSHSTRLGPGFDSCNLPIHISRTCCLNLLEDCRLRNIFISKN